MINIQRATFGLSEVKAKEMWTITLEGEAVRYLYHHFDVYLEIYGEDLSKIPFEIPEMPYKLSLRNHDL